MLTDRAEGLMRVCRVTKYATAALSYAVMSGLTAPDGDYLQVARGALLPATLTFFALLACGPSWCSWSHTCFRQPLGATIRLTVLDSITAGLSLFVGWLLIPVGTVSPVPLGPCFLSAAVSLFLHNRFLPRVLSAVIFRGSRRPRVLVLGPPDVKELVRHQVQVANAVGLEVVEGGISPAAFTELRVFNPSEPLAGERRSSQIHNRIHRPALPQAVDHVILVRNGCGDDAIQLQQEIQNRCDAVGVPLTVYSEEQLRAEQSAVPVPGDVSHGRALLQNPINQAAKRCLDILISVPLVLFVLPPLCVLVRFIQWIQSPGPLFYRQERCGQHGSTFHILKFRTMHLPEPGQTDLEENPAPRIFALGAILRESKLDEVPQFLNVLSGTMSIVGPRAHHAQDRIKFSRLVPRYPLRMQVKPGITGPAQYNEYCGVFLRESVESRVACDLDYISRWSIQTDVILVFKTGRVISESLFLTGLSKLAKWPERVAAAMTLNHRVLIPVATGESAKQSDQRKAA